MNWKNRLTNYNFWISIFSAVLLILQALKIEFDIAYVNEIFTAVLGLLVVIGIISDPTRTTVKSTETTDKEKEVTKGQSIPVMEEDETNNISVKNDFQAVLEKISNDLSEKFNEIKNFNLKTKQTTEQTINECDKQNSVEEQKVVKVENELKPAAAENDNPYINFN